MAENLEFWAGLFGFPSIDEALTEFDLTGLKNRQAQALSAGQKRRLGLARLLVTGRAVWALDEPTVSLDQSAVRQFGAVVNKHLERGGAALIATHIELGLNAETLDVSQFRPTKPLTDAFGEGFL